MVKTAVATKTKVPSVRASQSVAVPDFMKGDVGLGTENISPEDIDTPRLKLLQALSPELQEFNKLRAGMFWHSAAEHEFTEPFHVVSLYYDRRFVLWNPRDAGGGILARADDGIHWSPANQEFTVKLDKKDGGATVKWSTANTVAESGLAEWGSMNPADPNSSPAATRLLNFLFAFPDSPELMPAVFSFQRSSIKIGRKFLAKIRTVRAPLFGMRWLVTSFVDTNRAGQDFHNVSVQGDGLIEDKDLYLQYKGLYENFARTGIQIKDVEGLQDEDPEKDADDVVEDKKGSAGGKKPRY